MILPANSNKTGNRMIPPFEKFRKNPFDGRLITFDPGNTTGYSIWDDGKLTAAGQLITPDVKGAVRALEVWIRAKDIEGANNSIVVIEEYRIYSWKTEQHAWSDIHTIRLIGCLETLLELRGIRYQMCGAGLAKTFATDQKLEDWGFYVKGQKHARDAIRHAVYFYCSPPKTAK